MDNRSIYIKDENKAIIERAIKLLAFYEDKNLADFVYEQCKRIVEKYDGEVK